MIDWRQRRFKAMPPRSFPAPYNRSTVRLPLALAYAALCHGLFAIAALTMIGVMHTGMTASFGTLPWPWSVAANALLVLQFPLGHSLLLTRRGQMALKRLAPAPIAADLSTTTYVVVASIQVLALFALWTPSGIIWWRAEGATAIVMTTLYALAWVRLAKATFDTGIEVQSGLLGWTSLARGVKPVFPDMPTTGLYVHSRQPIYSSFALTLWTVPVWTPDQLALAIPLTAYCVLGPRLKERRMMRLFGERFARYRERVPYFLPLRL